MLAKKITITCVFSELTTNEEACFLECLTYTETEEGQIAQLFYNWSAHALMDIKPVRFVSGITTVHNASAPSPAPEAKERLRVTYLKALRDASSELQSGRNSRLSHILQSVPDIRDGEPNYANGVQLEDLSIAGITQLSTALLREHKIIKRVNEEITDIIQKRMMLKGDELETCIDVAGADLTEQRRTLIMLEKLDLSVDRKQNINYGSQVLAQAIL